MNRLLRRLIGIVTGTVIVAGVAGMSGCVSHMFYYPDRVDYGTPAGEGLAFEDVFFASRDGTRLHGWWVPAAGAATGTVVHFHGNAQNLSAHWGFVDWLPARGFNVFVFDYRGYGRSDGRPGRQGVYEDSVAALACVLGRSGVDRRRVVVLGQSLGGAQALAVLGREGTQGVKAVAIDSSFYSYRSIVRDKIREMPLLGWFRWPLSWLVIGDRYSPGPVADRISPVPLLLLHGTADEVIPPHHSQWIFDRAREPKTLLWIEGAPHTDALMDEKGPWRQRLVDFFLHALSEA